MTFSYLFQFRKNVIVYICFKFNIYSGSIGCQRDIIKFRCAWFAITCRFVVRFKIWICKIWKNTVFTKPTIGGYWKAVVLPYSLTVISMHFIWCQSIQSSHWIPRWLLRTQALEFRTPLFSHLVPPAIMVWIFVWKYIFEPFIHFYTISCYNSLVLLTFVSRSSCRITYIYIKVWNNRQNTKRESSLRFDILQ